VRVLWRWRALVAAITLASPLATSDVAAAASQKSDSTTMHEHRPCPGGYVALTFDDGPDKTTTPAIARELLADHSGGTFFFIGAKAQASPETVELVRSQGMEVGNHTYDHPFLDQMSADQVRWELSSTTSILDGMGGSAPVLFRAPYGRTTPDVEAIARQLGLTEVLWSYDSEDYEAASVDSMVHVAEKARNGDILLFHDGYSTTVAAIPKVLDVLDRRGICAGRVVRTARRQQAWLDYDGEDKTYYFATAARW
jgi:peptidoglycan-N-acetylglucosamine deacetylase